MDSQERAPAPQMHTPLPGGAKIAMEDACRWEAFYRPLGERETDVSCLRNMFTTGYPIRDKLDAQVGKWEYATEIVLAHKAVNPANRESAQPPVLVQTPEVRTSEVQPASDASQSTIRKRKASRGANRNESQSLSCPKRHIRTGGRFRTNR